MFLGRTCELKYLNTYYDRAGSQIMVVYGEKNVGKTTLLRRFVQDRSHYYYKARAASEREQRYQWGRELEEDGEDPGEYPSFYRILQTAGKAEHGKKVIIIDEFQIIIKACESFMPQLLEFVNDSKKNGQEVMVILCSSSIGWVENNMITKIGEAAYELSGFLKIKELSFEELREYFPAFSMEQCVEAYAILGGVPGHWKHFNDRLSIRENVCKYILDPGAFLFEEGQRIVEAQLREMSVYHTILASIAAGNQKLNDLYLHTGFSRAKISVYLKNLMELELVEKIFSYDTEGKANTQKGIYRISNHLVHFYFAYLYPNVSRLENMSAEAFYDKYIAPDFKNYVSGYFRQVCRQCIEKWDVWGKCPVKIDRIGEWIGKLGIIDIVVQNENGQTMIGGCNWDSKRMRYEDYEWLLFCAEKAKLQVDYVYLFSVGRFDEKLDLEAKVKQNLKLISLDEM